MKNKKYEKNMYISEQKLKFYVNAMKYQKYLKELQENPEKFKNNFYKSIQKKIKLLEGKKTKENEEFIIKNINYYKNLKIDTVDDILEKFNKAKEEYLDFLIQRIERVKKQSKPKKRQLNKMALLEKEAKTINNLNIDSEKIRNNFGDILILIINKILKMPKFSGYTNNWKDDFFINSVEKVLQYIYNFDDNIVSLKTGKPSTAFNYLTQIIMNAIIAVINKEKKNSDFLKKLIQDKSLATVGVNYIRNELSNEIKKDEIQKEIIANSKEELLNKLNDNFKNIDILTIKVTFPFDIKLFDEVKSKINDKNSDIQLRMSKISEKENDEK